MPENGNRMVTDFSILIRRIEKKEILLPDFQREFVWKDEEMQRKLVASVLAKMPVGSILLLKGSPEDYKCKSVGKKTTVDPTGQDAVDFLLDGQQRITVLSNVFSNVVFSDLQNFNELRSPHALKRRFFLRIPKWRDSNQRKDLFNVRTLDFPEIYNLADPDFLSGDVLGDIFAFPFTANDGKPYNPMRDVSPDLTSFCLGYEEGYLIPLFLMIPTGTQNQKDQATLILNHTITNIARKIYEDIEYAINSLEVGSDERNTLIDEVFSKSPLQERDRLKGENIEEIKAKLSLKREVWSLHMNDYLKKCIQNLQLAQICVDGTQRARAIDIYENLNRGGVSLNTFDLIMARVAKVNTNNFFERIVDAMKALRIYPNNIVPAAIRGQVLPLLSSHTYNATDNMRCYNESKNEIVSKFIDVFLDVFGFYYNNNNFDPDGFKVEQIKRDAILDINPQFINDKCEIVLNAIDRALFFFQIRCGIRNIQEINYSLMIVVVATVFLNDDYWNDVKFHELLEAWYWVSVFNGDYDKDQNSTMIRDLTNLFKTIKGERGVEWIVSKKSTVLNMQNFSDKDLLLMKKADDERLPKGIIRAFICQFYLSRTYPRMFGDNMSWISVFCDDARELEAHHIIPLGSVTTIEQSTKALRSNESHICNSPLNFVLISKKDNKAIGSKNISQYINEINNGALSSLQIQTFSSEEIRSVDNIQHFLESRFNSLQGNIQNTIDLCLGQWN